MRITPTQNQTFRAIQIKGIEPKTQGEKTLIKVVNDNARSLEFGEDFWGETYRYVLTLKNSLLEQKILQDLLKSDISGNNPISIKSVSDKTANKNISRFLNDGPSIRQFF